MGLGWWLGCSETEMLAQTVLWPDPVWPIDTALMSALPCPALPCPSVPSYSFRNQSSDWGFSQDLPKGRFPAFQETSINVWVEILCSSRAAEITVVQRQVINLDPKECHLQASLRQYSREEMLMASTDYSRHWKKNNAVTSFKVYPILFLKGKF